MKIRTLLKIQEAVEDGRKIPCDMFDEYKYYSESKGTYIPLLDMDLVHLVRIARKEMSY
jgi:hypothetical protein